MGERLLLAAPHDAEAAKGTRECEGGRGEAWRCSARNKMTYLRVGDNLV